MTLECGKCGKATEKISMVEPEGEIYEGNAFYVLCSKCWGDYLNLLKMKDRTLETAIKELWDAGLITDKQAESLHNRSEE